jgi:hypothetical protein
VVKQSWTRRIKNFLKEKVLFTLFRGGQRLGFDLLPRHFYSEVPDFRRLSRSDSWKGPHEVPIGGWDDIDGQLRFARDALGQCPQDVEAIHAAACERAAEQGFGPVEAAALWSFVATLRPPEILQIGCGVSTAAMLLAAEEAGYRPKITCVEPYASSFLKECEKAGAIALCPEPAQNVVGELKARVAALPEGSLLFVDSSHTLGPAGECTWLVCDVLPRLASRCYAHFHDVWFPYDYSPTLLQGSLFFWHESALLMAFLACNDRFRIAASLSMLHYERQEQLGEVFRGYRPRKCDAGLALDDGHYPSSCYLFSDAIRHDGSLSSRSRRA